MLHSTTIKALEIHPLRELISKFQFQRNLSLKVVRDKMKLLQRCQTQLRITKTFQI